MSKGLFPAGLLVLGTLGAAGCSDTAEPDDFISIPSLGGDVTLAAALDLPSGDGPHPAVVLVHGSGRTTRHDLRGRSQDLQSLGFASLRYDKRGVGQSTGVYIPVGAEDSEEVFSVLADDALAAVQYLKSRSDIDPTRIGLMGGSQAGWIMPLAASRSSDIVFMVSLSGATSTVGISDFYDAIAETLSAADVAEELKNFTGTHGFDPVPALEALTIPALWVYGGQDKSNPTVNDIAILERIIADFGKDFTICLFPKADHSLANVVDNEPLRVWTNCITPWLQETVNP